MHKTKIEGDHQTLSFGFMQLFNMMHAEGATTTSTNTNFSPRHLEKVGVKILKFLSFHCKARPLIGALKHQSHFLVKRPL